MIAFSYHFLPCVFFGYLFARATSEHAKSWGRDVGRVYAWNTLGSCLGIVVITLVGYEMHVVALLLVLALAVFALQAYWARHTSPVGLPGVPRWAYVSALNILVVGLGFTFDLSSALSQTRLFFGRDGVVGVDAQGNMFWNGLWHSKLSANNDHVGTNNWRMAVCAVLSHPGAEIRDACVIGLGTGITSATLAKLNTLRRVDTYEINRGLRRFHELHPEGTLHALENPKIRLLWQDARAGLALNEQSYDLIVTQPLYLKQAGSGILNSREFFLLVRSRLRPGGVFCLYSRGTEAQKRSMRETAATVFPYGESFFGGYLLVLAESPLALDGRTLRERFEGNRDDPLWREICTFEKTRDADAVRAAVDHPRLRWDAAGWIVTDDHPVIEYPYELYDLLEGR